MPPAGRARLGRGVRLATAGALALGLLAGSGCRTVTSRSMGQWIDDKAITAGVKMRLVGEHPATLGRVNVDTYDGVVYLSGIVESDEQKRTLEAIARKVDSVDQVVTNLTVRRGAAAASPSTDAATAPAATVSAHPLLSRLPGLARIAGDGLARPRGPWLAYDGAGRLVATIYTVSMSELAQDGLDEVPPAGGAVDHVSIYPMTTHPEVPQPQYHVVLWHVSRAEATKLH